MSHEVPAVHRFATENERRFRLACRPWLLDFLSVLVLMAAGTGALAAETLRVGDKVVSYRPSAHGATQAGFQFDLKGYRNTYTLDCANRRFLWTSNVLLSTAQETGNSAGADWKPLNPDSTISNAVYTAICPQLLAKAASGSVPKSTEREAAAAADTGQPSAPPPSPGPRIPVEESLVIHTRSGDVVVYNFFIDRETKLLGQKESANAVIRDTPEYTLQYTIRDQSFLISIHGGNMREARAHGERVLSEKLRISPAEMCRLSVIVAVSKDLDRNAAGHDYGLSFCPNGKPMPQATAGSEGAGQEAAAAADRGQPFAPPPSPGSAPQTTSARIKAGLPYAELSAEIYDCGDECKEFDGRAGRWLPLLDSRDMFKEREKAMNATQTGGTANSTPPVLVPDSPMGFRAAAYRNAQTNEIAIVYEGTSCLLCIKDWATNLSQPFWRPSQYSTALDFAQEVEKRFCTDTRACGSRVVLTGHSLGGALAQYVAIKLGRTAYTFNAAGLWGPTAGDVDTAVAAQAEVTHFRGKGYMLDNRLGTDVVPYLGVQFSQQTIDIPVDLPAWSWDAVTVELATHSMGRLRDSMFAMVEATPTTGGGQAGGGFGGGGGGSWDGSAGGQSAAPGAGAGSPAGGAAGGGDRIEFKDGNVLIGAIQASKVPFTSSFGVVEVDLGEVREFSDGSLRLPDGTVLKGRFGAGSLTMNTQVGELKVPLAEIVGIRRGSDEPTSGRPVGGRGEIDSKLSRSEAARLIIKHDELPTTVTFDMERSYGYILQTEKNVEAIMLKQVYRGVPGHPVLEQKGLDRVAAINCRVVSSRQSDCIAEFALTDEGKKYLAEDDKSEDESKIEINGSMYYKVNYYKVKVCEEYLVGVTGIMQSGNRAEVKYDTAFNNQTPFSIIELRDHMCKPGVIKHKSRDFTLYDDGWRVSY